MDIWPTHNEKLEKGFAKGLQHMVDFNVQLVGLSQRAPSVENGVRDFENANVDFGVGSRKSADKILGIRSQLPVMGEGARERTCVSVSHRLQKSESAITLIASPSCACTLGGQEIMRPTRRSLMVWISEPEIL